MELLTINRKPEDMLSEAIIEQLSQEINQNIINRIKNGS